MLYDAIIIGGGIIGCAIARELMRYQLRVLLIEKECEVGFGTSKSNSGLIHAGHHSSPSMLKGRLEWAGNKMWDALADDLGFGFKRTGELTVALYDEQIGVLEKLKRQGVEKGIPGLEIWDREQIRREEPNLSEDIRAALYAPTSGVVNPYDAVFTLLENAKRNGLEILVESPVRAVTIDDGSFAIKCDRAFVHGRFIINAAGLYSDQIAAMIGERTFTIQPRKGEEYLLDKRLMGLVKRTIFPCPTPTSKGILIIPTFDGTIMIGPTAHPTGDREDLTTTTVRAEEVFNEARRIVPGISERDCIAAFAGLRAVADTEDFIIGPTAQKGFINVAGIQSPGLTSAPAIAVLVVDILRDEGLQLIPKDNFVPTIPKRIHFASLSSEDQIRLSQEDPRYSHIICRCETVSERDVSDAIQAGACTLDGVKLRTRAGMGRCQGAFCSSRCMEILARELALPITAITKRGGDSWVLCQREDAIC